MIETYGELLERCLPLPPALAGEVSQLGELASHLDGEGDLPGFIGSPTLWLKQIEAGCGTAGALSPMRLLVAAMQQRLVGGSAQQPLIECDRQLALKGR